MFVEEGILAGGAGMRLECALHACRRDIPFETLAIRDGFAVPETPCDIYAYFGISVSDIVAALRRHLPASAPDTLPLA